MPKVLVNEETLQNIAQAIRDKNETQDVYYPSEMPQAIEDIITDPTGDANATALDIINPKTAYVQGNKLTGQIMTEYIQQDGVKLTYSRTNSYPVLYWNTKIGIGVFKKSNTEIIIFRIDEKGNITDSQNFDSYKLTAGAHGSDTIKCCDISDIPNDDDTYNFVYGIGNYVYSTTLNTDTFTIRSNIGIQSLTASATSITHNPVYRDIFSYVVINQSSGYTNANIYIDNVGTGTIYRLNGYLSYPGSVTMSVRSQWDDLGMHLLVINNFNSGVITYFPDTTTFNTNKKLHSGSTSTVAGFLTPGKVAFNGKIYTLDDVNYTITELNTTWLPPVNEGEMLYYLNNSVLVHYYSSSWYISCYPFNDSGNYLGGETELVKNKEVDGLYRGGNDIIGWQTSSDSVWVFSSKVGPLYSLTRDQQTFVDTSGADATSSDIEYNKTAYVNGEKVTGNVRYIGNSWCEADSITLRDDDKWILTPTRPVYRSATPDEKKLLDVDSIITSFTRYSDMANTIGLAPDKIKQGNTILDVEGTVVELNGETKTVTPTTQEQIIVPTGVDKNALTQVTVRAVDSTIDNNIISSNIKSGVTILGVSGDSSIVDTSDANATSNDIISSKTAYVDGQKITGTMVNNGALNYTPSDEAQTIPEGYTSGGIVNAADITTLDDYNTCLRLSEQIIGVIPTPEYTELEYIESTGTQYIDTGVIMRSDYTYNFKFALVERYRC